MKSLKNNPNHVQQKGPSSLLPMKDEEKKYLHFDLAFVRGKKTQNLKDGLKRVRIHENKTSKKKSMFKDPDA